MSTSDPSSLIPIVLHSETTYDTGLFKIHRDTLQRPGSPPYPYYTLITPPNAVIIIATTAEKEFLLVREYRHPTGLFLLGCPGGFIDPEEDVLTAAERELGEETGFSAEHFRVIGEAYPYAGISRQKTCFVTAENALRTMQTSTEPSEIIETCVLNQKEIERMISKGTPMDGTLGTALFFYKHSLLSHSNNS